MNMLESITYVLGCLWLVSAVFVVWFMRRRIRCDHYRINRQISVVDWVDKSGVARRYSKLRCLDCGAVHVEYGDVHGRCSPDFKDVV